MSDSDQRLEAEAPEELLAEMPLVRCEDIISRRILDTCQAWLTLLCIALNPWRREIWFCAMAFEFRATSDALA